MRFPETRNYTGFFSPSGVEAHVRNVPVIAGAIPDDLDGTFYRVAPDPQFPPLAADDIWFNCDGIVTAIHLKDGGISLKQRYVRTEKFKLEAEAGRPLFGAYRNPLTDDPSVKGRSRRWTRLLRAAHRADRHRPRHARGAGGNLWAGAVRDEIHRR